MPMSAEQSQTVPADELDRISVRWASAVRLTVLLWKLGPRELSLNALTMCTSGLFPLIELYIIRRLIDSARLVIERHSPLFDTELWLGALIISFLVGSFFSLAGQWYGDTLQETLKSRVQEQLLAKMQHFPLDTFEDHNFYDQLHCAQRGLERRLFSTLSFMFRIPGNVVTVVSLLLFIATVHPALPFILAAGSTLALLARIRHFRKEYILVRRQTHDERAKNYLEGLFKERNAGPEIRVFALRESLLDRWSTASHRLHAERTRLAIDGLSLNLFADLGLAATYAIALVGVVDLLGVGTISVGQFAAVLGAIQVFQSTLFSLMWCLALVDNDLRYIHDLFAVLDKPSQENSEGYIHLDHMLSGRLTMEHVSFTYPGAAKPAIDNISLAIEPGAKVALVGPNGAGKTTLIKLAFGIYKPTSGCVKIDGIDLQSIDPKSRMKACAAVFQNFVRYEATLRENVAFGDIDRMDDISAIEEAFVKAGADEAASKMPHGYDTLLGTMFGETDLSVGNWQKVVAARAFFKRSDLLVLDEPTASMDPRAEVAVYRQFRDLAEGKSAILISHRLGSAKLADTICVLQDGRLVEQGTHDNLTTWDSLYSRMLGIQASWYIDQTDAISERLVDGDEADKVSN